MRHNYKDQLANAVYEKKLHQKNHNHSFNIKDHQGTLKDGPNFLNDNHSTLKITEAVSKMGDIY
jgi:hypothetical protein